MVRRWVVAVVALVIVVGAAGCSSDGGTNDFTLPSLKGRDWTPAGLATAKATTDAIAAALPGQCADAAVSNFGQLAFGMEQVRSRVVPTAQMTCDVNDEVVEVSVFASARDRDRFVDDRSSGLCRLAAAQAKKYESRPNFPGLRWAVGAGNVTVQPDSESLARRLSLITRGDYVPRPCANGVTADWSPKAINTLDALGARIAAAGHGCGYVDLVGRETLPRTQALTEAQLPVAIGKCAFDATTIGFITYVPGDGLLRRRSLGRSDRRRRVHGARPGDRRGAGARRRRRDARPHLVHVIRPRTAVPAAARVPVLRR
jgi:hypothetical protein